MGTDLYFFEQFDTRKVPRRYRKLPEDLPESLRFAHLNPKVAALLASKERSQRPDNEDPFGDGMGKKSLLPDINEAFTNVRNQFDSNLSNDEDSQRFLFEEAKMSAPNILKQLARIIYFYEDIFKVIPKSLEYQLMSGWSDLTNDVTIVPREWQTQEMKEQFAARQQHEMNSEEETSDNDMLTGRSKSRMGTSERTTSDLGSKLNIRRTKPKLGVIEGGEEGDSVLKPDSRLGRRSDSRASAAGSLLKQHLDLTGIARVGSRRKGSTIDQVKITNNEDSQQMIDDHQEQNDLGLSSHRSICGMSPSFVKTRTKDDIFSMIAETPVDARSTALANPLSYMQTINFQLSNKTFEEKGWIMLKGRQEEIDQNEILEYCVTRMQESMKDIAAQRQRDVEQGHDNPVTVRYYGDTKRESLLKFRKSPVKSTPSPIYKGGKPRIPSIVDERNEGKKLMQASHQDGSTVVYYPSGRPAVIHSATGFGRPGFYTVVYEDGLDSKMLACFTPCGKGVCYYDQGIIRFSATERGGQLLQENGKLERKWRWPQANVKITEPVSFQLSNHVMFRCVSQSTMTLVFSCQKEMARFNVGPVPDAEDYKFIDEADQLLTTFTFCSKAAKDLMRIFSPTKKSKRKGRKITVRVIKRETRDEAVFNPALLETVKHTRHMSLAPTSRIEAPTVPRTIRSVLDTLKEKKTLEVKEEAKEAAVNIKTDERNNPIRKQTMTPAELLNSWKKKALEAREERRKVELAQNFADIEKAVAESSNLEDSSQQSDVHMEGESIAIPKSATIIGKNIGVGQLGAIPKSVVNNKSVSSITDEEDEKSSEVNLNYEKDHARSSSSLGRSRKSFDEETSKRAKSAKLHVSPSRRRNSSPYVTERQSETLALSKTAQDVTNRLFMPTHSPRSSAKSYRSETRVKSACSKRQVRLSDIGISDKAEYYESSSRRKSLPAKSLKSIMKSPRRHSTHCDGQKMYRSESLEDTTKRAHSASVYNSSDQKQSDERPTKSATAYGKSSLTVSKAEIIQLDQKAQSQPQSQPQLHGNIHGSQSFEIPRIVIENEDGEMLNVQLATAESGAQRSVSCNSVLGSSTKLAQESSSDVHHSSVAVSSSNLGISSGESVLESSSDLHRSGLKSATDLGPSSCESVLQSSSDVQWAVPKSATNVGPSSCKPVLECGADTIKGQSSKENALESSKVCQPSPPKVKFKESTIVSGRSQTDDAKPSSQKLQGRYAKPSSKNIQGEDAKPSGKNIQGEDAKPSSKNIQGEDAKPSSKNKQGQDAKPSSKKIQGQDAKPPSKKIQGQDTNPSSKNIQGQDAKPSSKKIRGEDAKPSSKKIRGEDAKPSSKKKRGQDAKPSSKNIQGQDAKPSSKKRQGQDAKPSSKNIQGQDAKSSSKKNQGQDAKPTSKKRQGQDARPHDSLETKTSQEFEAAGRASKRVEVSSIMKSILAFRQKVLAKKGIVLPDYELGEEMDDSQTSKSQASDIQKLMEDIPGSVAYELEADKELAKLQRKAKNLVEDWLEHYRIAMGLSSPYLQNVRDGPAYSIATRHAKSARQSDHQQLIRKAILGVDDDMPPSKTRIPSAPLGNLGDTDDEDGRTTAGEIRNATAVTFGEQEETVLDGAMSPTAMALLNRLTENASRRSNRSKVSSARSGSPSRQYQAPDRVPSASASTRSHCPLVIRQWKLGYERPQCRCSRHHIPLIMDLELDDFVATETPEGQLIVVMIVSSLFPGITKAEEMLNELYSNQNRNRTRPCVQSRSDMFRVFKYDINTAAEMSDHTQPLLLTRHSVVPGMFLIYCDGKLLFCDHIFNGYGNTRKDFKKQVMKSRHDAIQGYSLPKDFKFSPSQGRSGMRSAWGGEIGGAGVDKYSSTGTVIDLSLQPIHRPVSSSTDSGISKHIQVDAVKSTSRRPFLPQIDTSQIGTSSETYQLESVRDWVSSSLPGIQPPTLSKSTSFATGLSDSTFFNQTAST